MSEDRFTEVTQQSWSGRIAGAIQGVVLGPILILIAVQLLFWNEGRAVRTYKTLREGGKIAVSISCDRVDAGNEGKLVHVIGRAETDQSLADPVFGVSAAKVLKLQRAVEMYQWQESKSSQTRKKFGGGTETVTTYDYSRVWSGQAIDSSTFKKADEHKNPGSMPYASNSWRAEPVKLGAFTLSRSLVDSIDNYTQLEVPATAAIPVELQGKARAANAGFYIGKDPTTPQIGDLRVTFKKAEPTEVSVIARQINNTFEPYQAKAGGRIELLETGTHSVEDMIQSAQSQNKILTWVLRGVGFLVMALGWGAIFGPLAVLADVVPFVGNIVAAGSKAVAMLLALMLSLLTIAVAWIAYRPMFGIGLIVVALGLTVLIKKKMQQRIRARRASPQRGLPQEAEAVVDKSARE